MSGTQILVSFLSGGFAGAVFSFAVNWGIAAWIRWRLRANLTIESPEWHDQTLTVRVFNGYVLPLTKCAAYLTMDYPFTDIMQPPGDWPVHITPQTPLVLREHRICWAILEGDPQRNPATIDIYAQEKQSLLIGRVGSDKAWLGIASETGVRPYRVYLLGGARCYEGTIKIVAKEMKAKEFKIRIDLRDPEFPKTLLVSS